MIERITFGPPEDPAETQSAAEKHPLGSPKALPRDFREAGKPPSTAARGHMRGSVANSSKSAPSRGPPLNTYEPTALPPPILTKTPEGPFESQAHPHASAPFGVGGFGAGGWGLGLGAGGWAYVQTSSCS